MRRTAGWEATSSAFTLRPRTTKSYICRVGTTRGNGSAAGQKGPPGIHQLSRDGATEPGAIEGVRVLRIGFATNLLSTRLVDPPAKEIAWVAPAPAGHSTVIDVLFTREAEYMVRELVGGERPALEHKLLAYHRLPSGEAVCINSWFAADADKTLTMLADEAHPNDLVVSQDDPMGTGRPVRLITHSNPADGDFMRVWEFGAYWRPPS